MATRATATCATRSRSWEEVAKTWHEPGRPFQEQALLLFPTGGKTTLAPCPPGTVYGAGSPIGQTFLREREALGAETLNGAFLSCDMVRKELMAYVPRLKDAQIEMGKPSGTWWASRRRTRGSSSFCPPTWWWVPTGRLYLSDFYNNTSRRTQPALRNDLPDHYARTMATHGRRKSTYE